MLVVCLIVGEPDRVRRIVEDIDIASAVRAVGSIYRNHRHHLEELLLDAAWIVVLGPAGYRNILTDTEPVVKEMIASGQPGVEALVVGIPASSVVVHIIYRK